MTSPRTTLDPANPGGASTGPPPALPAAAFTGLFIASLVVLAALGSAAFPSPFAADGQVQSFFTDSGDALRIAATLQFAAAVPLAVLAAVISARLQVLGGRVPGSTIAMAGGLLASVFLGVGALATWTLSRPDVVDNGELVRALHALAFASGGVAHVAGLGLLVAGIAVPALLLGLLPRWLAVAGIVLAVLAELSIVALAVEPAAVLLPLARFPILAWLLAATVLLPTTRPRSAGPAVGPVDGTAPDKPRDDTGVRTSVRT